MSEERFARLVADALDELPAVVQVRLANVDVVVEDWPTPEQLSAAGIVGRATLLGLYEGVPITRRGASYGMVLPDKVTLFRGPILGLCHSDDRVRRQVQRTVVHELAHHFGIDDDRLRQLGAY